MRTSIVTAYYENIDMTMDFIANLWDKMTDDDELILVNAGNQTKITNCTLKNFTRIDLPQNISFSNSMNAGLRIAQGDYVIVIGNDGFPQDKEWISKLIEAHKPMHIVSPVPNRPPLNTYDHLLKKQEANLRYYSRFPAICWLFSKETYKKIGSFDERFLVGCYEDDDYAVRIGIEGGQIIVRTDVALDHKLSQTFNKFNTKAIMKHNCTLFKEKWGYNT